MNETVLALDDLSLPRRVAATAVLGEILATERVLADSYRGFAEATELTALRGALHDLAREKRLQAERAESLLARLAPAATGVGTSAPAAERPPVAPRAEAFLAVFQRERALEMLYHEAGTLLAGSELATAVGEAGARAARHRGRLRELYLRYS